MQAAARASARPPGRAAVALALLAACSGCGLASDPPNIVFILADDLGYADIGPEAPARTPHLARLAAEGLRFTDFHSGSSVCTPTRASLLTGRYPQRSGMGDVAYRPGDGLPQSELTIAELLRESGYATGLFGKWHLGSAPRFHPLRHGFDAFVGFLSGWIDYHSHVRGHQVDWWHGEERSDEVGYATHLITRHAVAFIEANAQRRFFAFVSYNAPHNPWQGPYDPAVIAPAGFSPENQQGFLEAINAEVPEPPPGYEKRDSYLEMIEEMDAGIGEILAALERHGIDDETFVFLHSDNGAGREHSNGNLRGSKYGVYEGGHRVPAIAWWPGVIAAGRVSDETAISMDLFPTAAALAGTAAPEGVVIDGVDLGPLLRGRGGLPERTLFWRCQPSNRGPLWAARQGPWKLVRDRPDPALFRLDRDPSEQRDLAAEEPERVAALRRAIDDWEREVTPRRKSRRRPRAARETK